MTNYLNGSLSVVCMSLIWCLGFTPSYFAQDSASENLCEVHGKIADRQGGVFPELGIIFRSSLEEKAAKTSREGGYRIEVKPGIYEVSLLLMEPRYRRAKVQVSCSVPLKLDITVLPACVSYGCADPSRYSHTNFSGKWTNSRELDLVIAYYKRKKTSKGIRYEDAVLTYDHYTISADFIVQDHKNRTISAEGNIWFDDGRTRRNFEKLSLKFTKSGPVISNQ